MNKSYREGNPENFWSPSKLVIEFAMQDILLILKWLNKFLENLLFAWSLYLIILSETNDMSRLIIYLPLFEKLEQKIQILFEPYILSMMVGSVLFCMLKTHEYSLAMFPNVIKLFDAC
jgi:hypothetical protein